MWKQRPDLIIEAIEDENLILDLASNRIHHLNVTASYVWRNLEPAGTTMDLVERYAVDFGVDHQTASRDVEEILGRLRALELFQQDDRSSQMK